MTTRLPLLLSLFLAVPFCAYAAPGGVPASAPPSAAAGEQRKVPVENVQELESSGMSAVEEPDAPDDNPDMGTPMEEIPGESEVNPAMPAPESKPPQMAGSEGETNFDSVELQGLNKVTAHTQTVIAQIGSVVRFGTIEIIAHRCWKAAPDERPENAALLEISEVKQGEAPAQIFQGWMFSSSPGISALEHPFYDVSVVACKKAEPPAEEAPVEKDTDKAPAKKPAKPKKKSKDN